MMVARCLLLTRLLERAILGLMALGLSSIRLLFWKLLLLLLYKLLVVLLNSMRRWWMSRQARWTRLLGLAGRVLLRCLLIAIQPFCVTIITNVVVVIIIIRPR